MKYLRAESIEALELNAPALPWNYNPSAWSQRIPICVLALLATIIAAYLALFQWGVVNAVWDPVFGKQSEMVLTSEVAKWMHSWFRIPDAALGAFAYLGDAVFGLAGSTRRWQYRPWLVIVFGIDVIPLGIVSAILVLLQGTVVGNWCFFCLVTAALSLLLVYFAYDEVVTCLKFLARVWRQTHDRHVLWKTFWGIPTHAGFAVGEAMTVHQSEGAERQRESSNGL